MSPKRVLAACCGAHVPHDRYSDLLYVLLPVWQGEFGLALALNGTSSVLYGTVAKLAPAERRARAFAIFYTCSIGAGAIAPWLCGGISDAIGLTATLSVISVAVLLVLPLSLPLRPVLGRLGHAR